MSKFVDGFAVQLNGKVPDEVLKTVCDELEIYVDKWKIDNGETQLSVPDEVIPIEYKEWLVTMKLEGKSKGTINAYNLTMVPFFMTVQMKLSDITTQVVKAYLLHYSSVPHGSCKKCCGPHTLNIMRIEMNSFFSWCVANDRLLKNPVSAIKPIKYEQKPIDVLSPIELSKVKRACETSKESALVEVLYSTGCRVAEVCNMKKSDVKWENTNKRGIVPIKVVGKGNKHRTVYLNADANIALRRYLDTRKDDNEYLFVGDRKHTQMTIRSIQLLIQKVGQKAGIDNLHPHEFRHTRATNFARESGSLLLTSKMLGHASVETTQKFYIVTDDSELEYEISKYC